MGLLDRFRTVQRDETPEPITPPVGDVLLRALLNSETITRDKALTIPAVAGAVDFISNAVACMPVKLYKEADGKVEEVKGDNRTKLLNGDTGDTLDAYQMKKAMVTDYLLGKGGYCFIRKKRNEVTGLFYVEDQYISIMKVPEPIYKDYQIIVLDKTYRPYEFIKLLRNTKDGASGTGLTEEISKELETAYQTLMYQLGMVKSGGNKRGFLKSQRKLGQEEIDVLKQAWRNLYGNNAENVVVLNNGLEFQEASNNSIEMQMNESKRTLQDEINGLFHIYPTDFDKTFKEAIYPVVKSFETALNRDLLLEKEKKDHYFAFDVKEIIKASLTERYQAYKTAKETGFLTINEIRRAEDLNWIEGLDVINVGLGAVLYDIEEQKYFTPNTGEATDIESATQGTDRKTQDMIIAHEETEAFDESGNSAERELRFNPNHGKDGKFTTGNGGTTGSAGKEARIAQLEEQIKGMSMFGPQAGERTKLVKELAELKRGPAKEQRPSMSKDERLAKIKEQNEQQHGEQSYMMSHRPSETGITADAMPADFYTHPNRYGVTSQKYTQESITALNSVKGKPDATITVYRSTVGDKINKGDWVTLSKSYAEEHNSHSLNGKGKVLTKQVSVKDIQFAGDDVNEWGYFPKEERELRFNPNHDAKTGRFAPSNGTSGGWDNKVGQMRSEFDALSDDKKAVYLWKNGYLSKEESLQHMKDGGISKYGDQYFQILRENGDFTPEGETRDNSNRAREMAESGEYGWTEARTELIKRDTGFSDAEVARTQQELNTWFSNRWDRADTETLDRYVEASPTYDGVIHRGLHFDEDGADAVQQFANLQAGDRINMRDKNSSWTSSEETARGYAHTGDSNVSSVVITSLKNRTSSPVADLSTQGEYEVLASSKAQWTVLRTDVTNLPNGNKKVQVYVVEADTNAD